MLPTQKILLSLLSYDPITGDLIWKARSADMFKAGVYTAERNRNIWNTKNAGKPAFSLGPKGYLRGKIGRSSLRAHRVIWVMVYGYEPEQIDHINGNRSDNRLSNLREVDNATNHKNMRKRSDSLTPIMGVAWDRERGKWAARIAMPNRSGHLGRFTCLGRAIAARRAAEKAHGYHPNHGRALRA